MKKNLLFASACALIFAACGNNISDELVKKYETNINDGLKKAKMGFEEDGLKIEAKDFSCKSDSGYIICLNDGFKAYASDVKIVEAAKIEVRTDEIYKAKQDDLITFKAYYDEIFKDKKTTNSKIEISGVKMSDEYVKNTKELITNIKDQNLKDLLNSLIYDSYKIALSSNLSKANEALKYQLNLALNSEKNPNKIGFVNDLTLKNAGIEYLSNELGIKFNPQTLDIDEKSLETLQKNSTLDKLNINNAIFKIFDYAMLNSTKFDLSLDSKNALSSYIAMAKGGVEMFKTQSSKEEEIALFDKIIALIDDISKESVYKLNANLSFKEIAMKDFTKEGISAVQKLELNGKDFTDVLKIIEPFMQLM